MTRKNSFDFIRFFAATLVVFSHSFALTGQPIFHIGSLSLGGAGVWIFFILSGYLISKSWDQYPRFNVFFAKRILRIFPGLIVAIILTILVVGLFFTSLPLVQFFMTQETFSYLNNVLLYNTTFTLPGDVFANNTYPDAVNGSIWTLAYEFTMYIVIAVIGALKLYKKVSPFVIWSILLLSVLIMNVIGEQHFAIAYFYLDITQLLPFALMFFSGVVMHKYAHRIKLDLRLGLLSLVLFVVLSFVLPTTYLPLFGSVFLAYAIFALGKSGAMSWFSKFGDFSYGMYIYAFPVQQMIVAVTNTQNALKLFLLSFIITLILAILSWHFIESRALRLKTKINPEKYPLHQTDDAW